MPEDRKTIPPKSISEFWNLVSFHWNTVSTWCYNNPLESRLIRWFIFVTTPHLQQSARHISVTVSAGCTCTGTFSGKQVALYTYICVCVRWMDMWQTYHHSLQVISVTFLSCAHLKHRSYMSVIPTLFVKETGEDNQERTNDVLQIPCCVTFDRACTVDKLACPQTLHSYSLKWKIDLKLSEKIVCISQQFI